jgi:hypothetical protein
MPVRPGVSEWRPYKAEPDIAATRAREFAQPDITHELMREDQFVAYCAAGHRLAKRKSITLDDLGNRAMGVRDICTGRPGATGSATPGIRRARLARASHCARLGPGELQNSGGGGLGSDWRCNQGRRRSGGLITAEGTRYQGSGVDTTRGYRLSKRCLSFPGCPSSD